MQQREISPPSVAIIGLGTIGSTVARHLVDSELLVAVYDLRAEACRNFVARGARLATSSADAARDADIVIEAVVNDAQVLDAITGADGVLSTLRPGGIVILHSTVRLSTVRQVAAAARARDVRVLDAGVSTLGSHGTGKLAVFVGGAPDDLDVARPVLSRYTHCLDYLGELGSGMAAKLVRNLLGYYYMAAAYEVLALAEAVGVELQTLRRVLEESDVAGQSKLILTQPTLRPITESEVARKSVEQFTGLTGADLERVLESSASIILKDIDDVIALADDADVDLELARDVKHLVRPFLLLPPLPGREHV